GGRGGGGRRGRGDGGGRGGVAGEPLLDEVAGGRARDRPGEEDDPPPAGGHGGEPLGDRGVDLGPGGPAALEEGTLEAPVVVEREDRGLPRRAGAATGEGRVGVAL